MPARKRETVAPNPGDKRFIRRDANGQFTSDQSEVGRSLSRDNDQKAKAGNKGGQGDKGDKGDRKSS
jgi:hypothetical protein